MCTQVQFGTPRAGAADPSLKVDGRGRETGPKIDTMGTLSIERSRLQGRRPRRPEAVARRVAWGAMPRSP
jgi:hypothetical protein